MISAELDVIAVVSLAEENYSPALLNSIKTTHAVPEHDFLELFDVAAALRGFPVHKLHKTLIFMIRFQSQACLMSFVYGPH
jgi:hypothetical protein